MPAAIAQSRSVQGVNTTSVALAFLSNVTAGNAIIVCCALFGTTGFTVGGCADNRSDTFTRDMSLFDGAHSIGVAIYSAPNATGGATTVTVSGLASGSFPSIAIYEVSGLPSSGILDTGIFASNSGSSASHPTGTTGTTSQANAITFAVDTHGGGTSTPTVNNSFTIPAVGSGLETNSSNQPIASAYKVLSATGAQSATFSWQNAQFAAGVAVYKAASGGTTYIDTGGATSVLTGSGVDVATLVDTGSATSPFTGSGADTAVLLDTGSAVSAATGSGADVAILVDAGTAELGTIGAGADAALFQDSATATSAFTGSGADAAVYSDVASATAILVGSGGDAPVYADTGAGVLAAIGSGDDSNAYIDTGGAQLGATGSGASATVFADAGQALLGTTGSGADAATFNDAGTAASALTGSGSDAQVYEDTGAGLAVLFGAGSDIAILADAGTGVLVAVGSGGDDAPGVFVPGTIRGPGAAGSIFAPLTAGQTRSPRPNGSIKG